jgi:hypothetical protein
MQPACELRFGASRRLGATASALPGGTTRVTDRRLELLDDRNDVTSACWRTNSATFAIATACGCSCRPPCSAERIEAFRVAAR